MQSLGGPQLSWVPLFYRLTHAPAMTPYDPSTLDVATPERVALSLPLAGLGYRTLAYMADVALMGFGWMVAFFLVSLVEGDLWGTFRALGSGLQAVVVLVLFAAQWLYWTLWEVAAKGQTPGKKLLRIRVVDEAGRTVGVFGSALRNLFRVVDFLPAFYAVGLLTMLVTRSQRRLGDLVAGTLLVRDTRMTLTAYSNPFKSGVDEDDGLARPIRALNPLELELVLAYLSRVDSLEPKAREALGLKLVTQLGAGPEWRASQHRVERYLSACVQRGQES